MASIHDAALKCDVEGLRRCLPHCLTQGGQMLYKFFLRAGAAIIGDVSDHFTWDPADYDFSRGTGLYFQKVVDAGGWKKFEQAHLAKLTKTFAPKFPMLPPEMVRHILTFGFHAGYY